jgi:hypothetical protein
MLNVSMLNVIMLNVVAPSRFISLAIVISDSDTDALKGIRVQLMRNFFKFKPFIYYYY